VSCIPSLLIPARLLDAGLSCPCINVTAAQCWRTPSSVPAPQRVATRTASAAALQVDAVLGLYHVPPEPESDI
jgi:hypothetical protein